jgi:hypothetical protein
MRTRSTESTLALLTGTPDHADFNRYNARPFPDSGIAREG